MKTFIDVLNLLCVPVFIYLTVICSYLALIGIAGALARRFTHHSFRTPHKNSIRFALVIPAHNEALQLKSLAQSLSKLNYPRNSYEICLIADHCEDQTASIGRELGFSVFERKGQKSRGKGQALDWFFDESKNHFTDSGVKLCVIIDADCKIHPEFLNEVAFKFKETGSKVIQSSLQIENWSDNSRTHLLAVAYSLVHGLKPTARTALHSTASLFGSGMVFTAEFLGRRGWPAHSAVEDLELSMKLLLEGVRVEYCPSAVVYTEAAQSSDQAVSQRKRWEEGRLQIAFKYVLPLMSRFIETREFAYLDGAIDLLTLPLSKVALLLAFELLILAGSAFHTFSLFHLLGFLIYIGVGVSLSEVPDAWSALLRAGPGFLIWKLTLPFRRGQAKKSETWVRTRRNSEK
jgi:cellulose synthase/poly-beta-1,6-N-acetylglucosamine synthase-like glycosyltransferase